MFTNTSIYTNTSNYTLETSTKGIQYYILDDGRIWSLQEAKFVSEVPEGEHFDHCHAADGRSSVEVLSNHLKRNNYPLGDLATDGDIAKEVREKRNALIAETDFMAMPDYPLDDGKRRAVFAYRQALRDVPAQSGFPRSVVWPAKP